MNKVQFESAVLSEPGGRAENQDAAGFLHGENIDCWILCDGLGGHNGGRIAAQLAVDTTLAAFETSPGCGGPTLTQYLEAANQAVCDAQERDARLAEMRTTAVLLLADADHALWAHVGDTRLYYLSGGRVGFQTKDHSVPQAMSDAGEITPDQIRFHEDRNRLLRSLGTRENLRPEIGSAPALMPGDAFLMATDGFWEYVNETEMEIEFAKATSPDEWLKRLERVLLRRARTDHDNYSAIGVFVK
jgi:serine/threonine protein phosphatase PrpC